MDHAALNFITRDNDYVIITQLETDGLIVVKTSIQCKQIKENQQK